MISGLIIGPQIVVALLAPWVGYHSETYGRKPLLLIGMGLEAVRAGLFAFVTNYPLMVAIQLLDGISGSIINVLTVLVISDLTTGTGRFNLAQGVIGAMIGIAASLSTSITGLSSKNSAIGRASYSLRELRQPARHWRGCCSRKPSRRNIPTSAFSDYADPICVIARLDRAIQYSPGLSQISKEFEEEFLLPSCELHFATDGSIIGVGAQDVDGDAADDGKILWPIILAGAGVVFAEDNVEPPVQLIFHAPMPARHFEQTSGVRRLDSAT